MFFRERKYICYTFGTFDLVWLLNSDRCGMETSGLVIMMMMTMMMMMIVMMMTMTMPIMTTTTMTRTTAAQQKKVCSFKECFFLGGGFVL